MIDFAAIEEATATVTSFTSDDLFYETMSATINATVIETNSIVQLSGSLKLSDQLRTLVNVYALDN